MSQTKTNINEIAKTLLEGGYFKDGLIGALEPHYKSIDLEKLGLKELEQKGVMDQHEIVLALEYTNDIRMSSSKKQLKLLLAYSFLDGYNEYYNEFKEHDDEEFFSVFLTACGYPQYTLFAIDLKYMLDYDAYIDIHRKCFELIKNGATAEEIANIL